jgi:hypothetical protein
MKNCKFYFLMVCFLFAITAVNAQTLDKIYSGEKLPAQEGWQELKLDKTVNPDAGTVTQAVVDGALKLQSANEADQFSQLGWYKTGLGLSLSTGYTIEIKAKVVNATKYGAFNIQGYDNEGKGFRLGIYDNYLAEFTNPFAATNVLNNSLDNSAAFHIYRLAVQPDGTATLYRDGELTGTFPLSAFYFDNIIENGGFEDGDSSDLSNSGYFPDFKTDAIMYRTNEADNVKTGNWSLIIDNDGAAGLSGTYAKSRDIAVKPGSDYFLTFARKRITGHNDWAWRDVGAFYDNQDGTLNGADHRTPNLLFTSGYEENWLVHNQAFKTPEDVTSFRFEFPSWEREGNIDAINTFDDFYVREELGLTIGTTPSTPPNSPVPTELPAGATNLINNPGFEDTTGWETGGTDNEPAERMEAEGWYCRVRIQTGEKPDDTGSQWAHTGNNSLRYSSFDRDQKMDYRKDLDANKTYRFGLWFRNANYGDPCEFTIWNGDERLWTSRVDGMKQWSYQEVVFTTDNANKQLRMTTVQGNSDDGYGWHNLYLDDLVLYEVQEAPGTGDPLLAGKTNLFANGDFEDETLGNDGEPFEWALASQYVQGEYFSNNYPVSWSDLWGTWVRLQDQQKGEDTGLAWAHSGTKSFRFSYLGDGREQTNMDFRYELDINKTYTFVFWFKTAAYNDRGNLFVSNGDIVVWGGDLDGNYNNWTRQSVTFTTTTSNHTLRLYTKIGGWFNFYLDDIFLYEEETYVPFEGGESYLFFGKSTGTQTANVEIEYVAVSNTGAYPPGSTSIKGIDAVNVKNLKAYSTEGKLTVNTLRPASVRIYNVAGTLVAQLNVQTTASITLPKGVYIVKSVSGGLVETIKVVNK